MDILFPRTCPVCGEITTPPGELICPACFSRLSLVKAPVCSQCGKEILSETTEYCRDCSRRSRTFIKGMALINYNEAARQSMARIKYNNRREHLDFYARAMSLRFSELVRRYDPDVIVPVPVHASRKRSRGFNQAGELALRLGELWQLPVDGTLLLRIRKTDPQKELSAAERLKNLEDAFAVRKLAQDDGDIPETVLLVDDIYTTGSTVEACSRVLKQAGVKHIYVMVICIGEGES